MATPAAAVPGNDTTIFINEIHYDNDSTDTAEGVEVAGPAGASLQGWSIVAYNGNGGTSYKTVNLSGLIDDEGAGSGAVWSSISGLQNGSPDGVALVSPQGTVVQFLSYEGTMTATDGPATGLTSTDIGVAEGPSTTPGLSLQLTGSGETAGEFTWTGPVAATAGALNAGQTVTGGPVDPGDGLTLIHEIQGSVTAPDPDFPTPYPAAGDTVDDSPMLGQTVTVEAVVTGWDDEAGQSNSGAIFHTDRGFFVQEEDADTDTDATTSEGIFVQFSSSADNVADYQPGDLVRVTGTVVEHFEFTAIAAGATIQTMSTGNPLPTPAVISEGITRDGYEALEGMRVSLPVSVANSGGTNRFGELMVTPGSAKNILVRPATNPSLLSLDSDAGAGNPALPRKPEVASSTVVKADLFATIENTVGPLAYTFDLYKILVQPSAMPTITPDPSVVYPYNGLADAAPDQVRVTALNVENFFPVGVTHDGSPVSQHEYDNKLARIVDAVDRLLKRPDIVGVEEVNDLTILEDVASTLGGYTAYLEEGNDNRGIDVGFLVKDTMNVTGVTQVAKTFPDTADNCGDTAYLFDRPPLQLDVNLGAGFNNETLSVINNHFSSKAAPDVCRDAQATVVRDTVASLEAAGNHVIVTGDLNAFEDETPLQILEDGTTSLSNMWSTVPAAEAYSFQFSGRLQTLDHLLITSGLNAYMPELVYAHFDTHYYNRQWDEPTLTGSFTDGHKLSDHDPPVLTLTPGDVPPPVDTLVGGTVVSAADGSGVTDVTVELYNVVRKGKNERPGSLQATTTTDSAGAYAFTVDAGCWFVRVVAPTGTTIQENGGTSYDQQLCVEADQSNLTALATIVADGGEPPAAGLEVEVVDGGGAAVAGQTVELWSTRRGGSRDGKLLATGTTDANGTVTFTPGAGTYAVYVNGQRTVVDYNGTSGSVTITI